jgi:hypothetical protein
MIAAVGTASSSTATGVSRRVERRWPRTRQAKRSATPCLAAPSSTCARRRAGLRSFAGAALREPKPLPSGSPSPGQSPRSPDETVGLGLRRPRPLDPVSVQTAILETPASIGRLGHIKGPDSFSNLATLRNQDIHLPQLGDERFSRMLPPFHGNIRPMARGHTSGRATFQETSQYRNVDLLGPQKSSSNSGPRMGGGDGGIRTLDTPFGVCSFSKRVPSAARPRLRRPPI